MDRSFVTAALIMSLGMMFIPLGDTAGKLLTALGAEPVFVTWTRFTIGAVVLLPFAFHAAAFRLLGNWRIWLRAAAQAMTIVLILKALSTEPIANVYGAFFLGPTISYGLSIWLLKEQGSPLRLILLLVGLGGVFLVVRPGFGMTPGLAYAAASGAFYGVFLTASRWLAPLGRPLHLLLTQLLIGTVLLTPFGIWTIPTITPEIGGLVVWSALASMFANLCLVIAYARAAASALAPFVYVQLVGAALYGAIFFGTYPDWLSALGILLIFFAGVATLFFRSSPRLRGSRSTTLR